MAFFVYFSSIIAKSKLGRRLMIYFSRENPKAIIQRDCNIKVNGYEKYIIEGRDIRKCLS